MRAAAALLLAAWLLWACAQAQAQAQAQAPAESVAQAQWRVSHPLVRWAPEQDYPPMVYMAANGSPAGLSVDLLQRVAQQAGLQLQTLPAAPLHELLRAAAERRVDLLTSLRPTPARAQHLLFTRPYVSVPAVLVQREGATAWAGPQALAGRKVAVGQGYAVEAVMRQRHPQVLWQPVPHDAEGLARLVRGEVDAMVVDAASLAHIVQRDRLPGLRAGAQVGFDYELCFAVRRDWPELRDLLDLAITAVPVAERQALLQRWLPSGQPGLAPPRSPWATRLGTGLLLLALAAAAAVAWRKRRRRRQARRAEPPHG